MSDSEYIREIRGFVPTDDKEPLRKLAAFYHDECERYDRTVCTGPRTYRGIMPANPDQQRLIQRNADALFSRLVPEAAAKGFSPKELRDAIHAHRPRHETAHALKVHRAERLARLNQRVLNGEALATEEEHEVQHLKTLFPSVMDEEDQQP